ncbi:MAG: hypothetical protein ACI95C_000244 [Pseudohongiellaceae bacterium]|jgi:hypothetical protein
MKYLITLLLAFTATAAAAQSGCTDQNSRQRINGSVTRQDFETYVEVPFEVPLGTKQLSVSFDYDRSNRTTIDLGLLDPNGFRGWSGGNKRQFTLSANSATASYSTGPIVPGTWHVLLGVPNIREGQTANFEIQVTLNCDIKPSSTAITSDRGEDWYTGELHSHSGHSDGSCENTEDETILCPTFRNIETAANRELDFIAITDHNSVSQNTNNEILQSYFANTLLIPGREVTTFYGHANVFGTTEFIDFRLSSDQVNKADFLLDQVQKLSGLFSINHPGSPSGEDCMGCGWVLDDTDYSRVDAIEVVNAGFVDLPRGQAHIDFWHERLNAGFKITGIGGSDSHLANRATTLPSAIGNPSTWVFAKHLSVFDILEGIRSGNVFIEVMAGSGKITTFAINQQPMGSEVEVSDSIKLQLSWRSEFDLIPRWIHQGNVISLVDEDPSSANFSGSLDASSLQVPGWLRVDLLDSKGVTRVIGNPVYLRERSE